MNQHLILESVQELLRQGDTAQALQMLINFLEKEAPGSEFLRTLRVIEANFNATRQQEQKGILEFSEARREYARTNDAILSVLENLASGRKTNAGTPIRSTRQTWLIGAGIFLLAGAIAGYLFFSGGDQQNGNKRQNSSCPDFRADGFKIMVLEFQKLSGEESRPELGIQSRIRALTERNKVNTDVRILNSVAFDGVTLETREAVGLARECQANLIIWGQYEKTDSLMVDIRYAFAEESWPPGIAAQTFKNVSEIKADQMKINNLDEAVFRLCTALALHEGRMDLAEKWLNNLENPNAREQQWKEQLAKK